MTDQSPLNFRAGYAAIIGEPNVGKSTLMNGLLQQKISIVTAKPQTTRHKVLGILSGDDYQVVFLDTPGIMVPRYALHEAMMRSAVSAIDDADVVLFMIDSSNPQRAEDAATVDGGHDSAAHVSARRARPADEECARRLCQWAPRAVDQGGPKSA